MGKIVKQESIFKEEQKIVLFRISNSSGAYVEITNIGASIVSAVVPDKNGIFSNVSLRYENLEDYLSDNFYLGATIGRFSNRISNACFSMNGEVYHLDKNDGKNTNHGGSDGFNKKIFNYYVNNESVTFFIESPDREGGFPGNLKFEVTYSFSDKNDLKIEFKAISDKETPVNFTNHCYFNLSGNKSEALDCLLKVDSEKYLETNNEFLPTGQFLKVEDSAFDFRSYKTIKDMMPLKDDNLEGYNAYFIKSSENRNPIASLKDGISGRTLDVYSSMPGLLFYTGDFLSNQFIPFQGLCLEAQYYPDGMNHAYFETNILTPHEEKVDTIIYSFNCDPM